MLDRIIAWLKWGTITCPYCHKRTKWAGVQNVGGKRRAYGHVCVEDGKVYLFFLDYNDDTPELRYKYTHEILDKYDPDRYNL